MNIAVDVTPILPGGECGGAEHVVYALLKGLGERALSDRFILLTASYNNEIFRQFDKYGMKRICILQDVSRNNASLWRSLVEKLKMRLSSHIGSGILKKNNVSLLFCPMTAITYHEIGIPTVSLIHDLQHMYYPSFFTREELVHRTHFYKTLSKKVDHVICVSEFTKQSVLDKLNIPEERVSVIYNCIHDRLHVPSSAVNESVLKRRGLNNIPYCIYPANLWPHKNHTMLLVAFNMFSKKYPDYNLHLIFTGAALKYSESMCDSVKQMGLEDRVHLLGYLDEEEMSVIWQGAHFLVYPSLFEGFGIPLIEAMQYNKPIAASNAASIPEVAGDAAIYFDPKKPDEIVDSMYGMMEDKERYNSLVKHGQRQVDKFHYDDMINKYISVLHKAAHVKDSDNSFEVSGIYNDGWAGRLLHITYRTSGRKNYFVLEGYIPESHPGSRMHIKLIFPNGRSKKYSFSKNDALRIKEKLPSPSGTLTLKISGGFVPCQCSPDTDDSRTLTFMPGEVSIADEESGEKLYDFTHS